MMGRKPEAAVIYTDLINRNPENWAYYKGLEDSVQPGKCLYLQNSQLAL
jgi:hypothetical protein